MKLIRTKWGTLSLIARELGVSRSVVSGWRAVPAERLLEIERITGIPREVLRPELYDFSGRTVLAVSVAPK
ncbi:MAG TPA: YdaS family helix-turn-helix protein [Rhodocyclaceae bacterium]|nr:YdaS family helix-turn-helix protein [Rhodocyclaceae bacterium]